MAGMGESLGGVLAVTPVGQSMVQWWVSQSVVDQISHLYKQLLLLSIGCLVYAWTGAYLLT